ncbi:uncharacterized protein LOC143210185 [Lasioglossum baleicum]|uniref:uncharacterized protein LOC143210185 n=1 Tax=Lasioglossum baleicum TaxID=434251 RepID=UPI003FCEDD3B
MDENEVKKKTYMSLKRKTGDLPYENELATQGKKIKEKVLTPYDNNKIEMDDNKDHTTENTPIVRLYPEVHKGTAIVEIRLIDPNIKKRKRQNLIEMSRRVSQLTSKALELNSRGFNKAEVLFRSKDEANNFVIKNNLNMAGFQAQIPIYETQRKGLIKGYPTEYDVKELIDLSKTPCKILDAKRMGKKTFSNKVYGHTKK